MPILLVTMKIKTEHPNEPTIDGPPLGSKSRNLDGSWDIAIAWMTNVHPPLADISMNPATRGRKPSRHSAVNSRLQTRGMGDAITNSGLCLGICEQGAH